MSIWGQKQINLYPGNVPYNYSIKLDKHGVLASLKETYSEDVGLFLSRAMLWPT